MNHSEDQTEPVPSESAQIGASPGEKPGLIMISLFSIFKALVSLYVGISTTSALTSRTVASGYPAWIFVYAFFLIALGVAYLCALVLILLYKRLGLILMIVFLLSELLYTALLVIGGIGSLSLVGLSGTVLLLSIVIRYLSSEPHKSFFT